MTAIDTLKQLPMSERIELVQELWESIATDAQMAPISEEQRAILDERLKSFEQDKKQGREADLVLKDLRHSLR